MTGSTTTVKPDHLHFDPSGLLEVFGEDHTFLSEFVGLFREQSTLLLSEIETAYQQGDAWQVERAAHTLKGMLANLGYSVALGLSTQLEMLGAHRDLEDAGGMIAAISSEVDLIQGDLERLWS